MLLAGMRDSAGVPVGAEGSYANMPVCEAPFKTGRAKGPGPGRDGWLPQTFHFLSLVTVTPWLIGPC